MRSIGKYTVKEYGTVKVKLAQVMKDRGVTRNHLRELTGVKYDVIDRYYKGTGISMIDLNFFAKVCYVLECDISDLLEYEAP